MVAGIPKKIIQRYFYQFKVPLRYRDIERLLELCAQPNYDIREFPKRYRADTLIRIKRAMESCRKSEGLITRSSAEAESNLLEAAADMGDSTAVALLCGARMRQPDVSEEDMTSGSNLLRQLMDAKFPLAFKVSGDLAYSMGRPSEALKFYELALANGLEDQRMVTECYRNIGHLAFQAVDLVKSRDALSKACMLAEDQKQVSDCHFFLAQLRETDRLAVRKHLEVAATYGFHDAFLPLGNLLLNWFGEVMLAKVWFQLATATDKTGMALIGLLDSAARLHDHELARSTLISIQKHPNATELLKSRPTLVQNLSSENSSQNKNWQASATGSATKATRWDF